MQISISKHFSFEVIANIELPASFYCYHTYLDEHNALVVKIPFCLFLPHSNLMTSKCPPSMMTPLSSCFCLSIHKLSTNSSFQHNKVLWVCGFLGKHGIYIPHFIFKPAQNISILTWFAGDVEGL